MTTYDVRHARRARRWIMAGALLIAATACSGGDSTAPSTTLAPTAASLAIVSGGGQTGTVGLALSAPLVVKVATSAGVPVVGSTVTFAVSSGAATLSPTTATSDANG